MLPQFDSHGVFYGIFGTTAGLLLAAYLGRSLIVERLGKIIDRRVDHQFNEKLEREKGEITKDVETHKSELTQLTETLKAGQQRDYYRFSLYEQKRQEVYAETYKRIYSTVVSLVLASNAQFQPLVVPPTREGAMRALGAEQLIPSQEHVSAVPLVIEDAFNTLNEDEKGKWIHNFIAQRRMANHQLNWQSATNYIHANLIYLTRDVQHDCGILLEATRRGTRVESPVSGNDFVTLLGRLYSAMVAELTGTPVNPTAATLAPDSLMLR